MTEETKTHGGRRPGQGRPTLPEDERTKQVAISLKGKFWKAIEAITPKRSAFISDLVERELKRLGKL